VPSRTPSRFLTLLSLIGAVVFWGTSFVATKTALGSFAPMTVIWLRMTIATVVFAPAWFFVPKPDYRPGDFKWLALIAFLQAGLFYLAEGFALRLTTSSQAGVVSAIVPLLVAVGAWLFLGERLSPRSGVAIAISIVGVAMLSLSSGAQPDAPNPALGNFLEVIAMSASAGSMIALKHVSHRYNPWFLTGLQSAFGALFFLPGALMAGPETWASATPEAWAAVIYLGVVVSLIAFGLYNTAVTHMPANRAALAVNLVPAVAMLAGWLVLDETLSPVQLISCAVIIGAVVLSETGAQPVEPTVAPAAVEAVLDQDAV
jgi:drug/metabolite transporter (DMT)-like permease